MTSEWRSGVASVHPSDRPETTLGTAFLVSRDLALTCAHVLSPRMAESAPSSEVVLRFPFADEPVEVRAAVATGGWFVGSDGGEADLAVLQLASPVGIRPPLMGTFETAGTNESLTTVGFPDQDGRNAALSVVGPAGRTGHWLQLEVAADRAQGIEKGFSGAPVWSGDGHAVVGMVVARDREAGGTVSFMVPVEKLRQSWPAIEQFCAAPLQAQNYETHWLPRARGVEPTAAEEGWYFAGRVRVLDELVAWLRSEPDDACRFLEGPPGAGKSSILAMIGMLTEPKTAPDVPLEVISDARRPPTRQLVPAYLGGKTLHDAIRIVCSALGIRADEPSEALLRLSRLRTDVLVLADGLDEAALDSRESIAREFLRPLASLGSQTGIRVLTAVQSSGNLRSGVSNALGVGAVRLDLTSARLRATEEEVESYVIARLLQEDSPSQPTPYRDDRRLATDVAGRWPSAQTGTS
jgi:hypothetical protein